MNNDTELLLRAPLFSGFSARELDALLPNLAPLVRQYEKGDALLLAGQPTTSLGVVLAGRLCAAKLSPSGAESIAARLLPGDVFGDVLAAGGMPSPVIVTAATSCRVMLIPAARIFAASGESELRRRLLANLVRLISEKYFALDARIDLLTLPGIRRRMAAWLLHEAAPGQAECFHSLTRAQLAAHLGCERAALCRELSRMAADGLIAFDKRRFTLLDRAALVALL